MVRFLKENSFPMTVILETEFDYVDSVNEFKGHYTRVKDENGNILSEFAHEDLRARIHWVNGFFTALRMQNKIPETKFVVYEYTEDASEQYRGTRFMTTYDGTITENADPEKLPDSRRLKVIAKDITQEEADALINEVSDKNADAYLNSLPDELRNPTSDDLIKKLLNGNYR